MMVVARMKSLASVEPWKRHWKISVRSLRFWGSTLYQTVESRNECRLDSNVDDQLVSVSLVPLGFCCAPAAALFVILVILLWLTCFVVRPVLNIVEYCWLLLTTLLTSWNSPPTPPSSPLRPSSLPLRHSFSAAREDTNPPFESSVRRTLSRKPPPHPQSSRQCAYPILILSLSHAILSHLILH